MTYGSLFTGIHSEGAAWDELGWKPRWFAETNRQCSRFLEQFRVPNLGDVTRADFIRDAKELGSIDLVIGGDPCPVRSRARGNRPSKHPDLSGYFLAVVGGLAPRWVVRENVPSPDAIEFATCLELLGYRVTYFAFDSRDWTGQSRRRDYCIASLDARAAASFERIVFDASDGRRFSASSVEEETPIAACLTTHRNRLAAEDSYCYEAGIGLRILDRTERELLQGLPRGWTDSISNGGSIRATGNAMTVPILRFIGECIERALLAWEC